MSLLALSLLACGVDVAPAPAPAPAPPPPAATEVAAPTPVAAEPVAEIVDHPPTGPLEEMVGTWEQLHRQERGWVIMSWCHAGTATVRIDTGPTGTKIVANTGQDAELYLPSRITPLADGDGLGIYAVASHAPEDPVDFELHWEDREAGIASFPRLVPGSFVHESHAGDFSRVNESEDCGTP